jgi:hypothetical protein
VENDDSRLLADYPTHIHGAQLQAITRLLERYYRAAAVGDGVTACSSMASNLVDAFAEAGAHTPIQDAVGACATTVSSLLRAQHAELTVRDATSLRVIEARAKDSAAIAVLGFRHVPESEIIVVNEHGPWKVDALRESRMP